MTRQNRNPVRTPSRFSFGGTPDRVAAGMFTNLFQFKARRSPATYDRAFIRDLQVRRSVPRDPRVERIILICWGLIAINAMEEINPVARPHTAPLVLKRRQNSANTMAGRLAEAATANANPTRNATLNVGPKTIAIAMEIAPTTHAVMRATRTSKPGDRSFPWWITLV